MQFKWNRPCGFLIIRLYHRGTADNLIFMTQNIQERLIGIGKACVFFFDISKAFDKIRHLGLLYKLVYLEVPMYLIDSLKFFWAIVFSELKPTSALYNFVLGSSRVSSWSIVIPCIGDILLGNSKLIIYSAFFADDFFKKIK